MNIDDELKMMPYGLITVSCLVRPGEYLALQLEVEEFLIQYVGKLRKTYNSISKNINEFDEKMMYLYKPRFVYAIGHQDIRIDFLVDDFELLQVLPIFNYASKQSFHLCLIPDFSYGVYQSLWKRAEHLILNSETYFSNISYQRTNDQLNKDGWPIQSQVIFRLDCFMKFELGLRLYRDIIYFLINTAIEFSGAELKILPVISFDSNEIDLFLFAWKKSTVELFVRKINMVCNLEKVLIPSTKRLLHDRLIASIDRRNIKIIAEKASSTGEGIDAFVKWYNEADELCKLEASSSEEWQELRNNPTHEKIALFLGNARKYREYFRTLPKSIVIGDIFLLLLRAQKEYSKESMETEIDEIFALFPIVHSSTFYGVPLELFLNSFYAGKSERIALALENLLIHGNLRSNTKNSRDLVQNPCEEVIRTAPIYRIVSAKEKELSRSRIMSSISERSAYVPKFAELVEKNAKHYGTFSEKNISGWINLFLYTFSSMRLPISEKELTSEYQYANGRPSLRKPFKNIHIFELIDQIADVNSNWKHLQYTTTESIIASSFSDLQDSRLPSFIPAPVRKRSKKIHLEDFRNGEIYNLVASRFKAFHIPKHLSDNFLSVIDLYNTYITDASQFEGFIELTPIFSKMEKVFREMTHLKKGYIYGEIYEHNDLGVKNSKPTEYKILALEHFESQLENFLEIFKKAFHKRFLTVRIDQDSFQSPVEHTSTNQVFFSIAQGVQRTLLSYFFQNEPNSFILRSNLLAECEDWRIFQRHNIFATSSFLSKNHVLFVENLGYLFHEIGHFIAVSNILKKTEDKLTCEHERKILKKYFLNEKVQPNELKMDDETRLVHEVVADLFHYHFSAVKGTLSNESPNFHFEQYVRKAWYQVYVHRYGGLTKEEIQRIGTFTFIIQKMFLVGLITQDTGKEPSTQEYSSIWNQLISSSRRICRDYDFFQRDEYSEAATTAWVSQTFTPSHFSVFRELYYRLNKYFKRDLAIWAKQATAPNDPEKIYFHSETREGTKSFLFESASILNAINDRIFEFFPDTPESLYLKFPHSDVGEDGSIKLDETILDTVVVFPSGCKEFAIHPTIGLFSCNVQARSKVFNMRQNALLSLLDISLQSKGELIDQILAKDRRKSSLDIETEKVKNIFKFHIEASANYPSNLFLLCSKPMPPDLKKVFTEQNIDTLILSTLNNPNQPIYRTIDGVAREIGSAPDIIREAVRMKLFDRVKIFHRLTETGKRVFTTTERFNTEASLLTKIFEFLHDDEVSVDEL